MWAARLYAPGDIRCERVAIPRIGPHDALIRVKACGVCGSDHSRVMRTGTYSYPTTIGHEFSGQVVEIGSEVTRVKVGDRVAVIPLIPCGKCSSCKVGEYHLCDDYSYFGSRQDGGFAEYVCASEDNLVHLGASVDWETGAMTDPASVALHAIRRSHLAIGDSVVILGAGPIGVFAMQLARLAGAGIVAVVDIVEQKLEIAKNLGANIVVNAKNEDPVSVLRNAVNVGFDRVIEIAGSPVTQEQAIMLARKGGAVVFCGISHAGLPLSEAAVNALLRGEIEVLGSWNSGFAPSKGLDDWDVTVDLFDRGLLKGLPLISHRYNLHQVAEAFTMASSGESYYNKVMILP